MIGLGAIVYLSVGGPVGALLFAVGLLTICVFKLDLFTGKIGLVATGDITFVKLLEVWVGNFIGTFIAASVVLGTPRFAALSEAAAAISQVRMMNGPVANLLLGIPCGVLMFIAVTGYKESGNSLFVFIPVAAFISCGFNHCVADMMYIHLGAESWTEYGTLIPTTIGNAIGAIGFNYIWNKCKFCRTM